MHPAELERSIYPVVNRLLQKGELVKKGTLSEEVNIAVPAIEGVLIDPAVETEAIGWINEIKPFLRLLPASPAPGQLHYQLFAGPGPEKRGLAVFLDTTLSGGKRLILASPAKEADLQANIYRLCIISTENGLRFRGSPIYEYGGIGKYIGEISSLLSEFMKVTVLCYDPSGILSEVDGRHSFSPTLEVRGFPKVVVSDEDEELMRDFGGEKGAKTVLSAIRTGEVMVASTVGERFDAVYFHAWYNGFTVPAFRKLHPHAAALAIFHSIQPLKRWKVGDLGERGFAKSIEMERQYAGVDGIIALSDLNEQAIREAYEVREATEVRLIPHGVNVDEYRPCPPEQSAEVFRYYFHKHGYRDEGLLARKKVLYVGRLSGQKGVDLLVEAFKQVKQDSILVLIACSPDTPAMQELAERVLSHSPRIVWINEHVKNRADMVSMFSGADVFVCPSRSEPFGLVIPEAMATQTPVVAFRGAGGPDYIVQDGETGFLVPYEDVGAMAQAIERLLKDPGLAGRMGEAARRRVEELFSVRRTAIDTFLFIRDLILAKVATSNLLAAASVSANITPAATGSP